MSLEHNLKLQALTKVIGSAISKRTLALGTSVVLIAAATGVAEAPRAVGHTDQETTLSPENSKGTNIVIYPNEQKQIQDLSKFINSVVAEPFNKLNLDSEVTQRSLLDQRRTPLINGTRWSLDWVLPGDKNPWDNSAKLNLEAMLSTKGRGSEVDEYRLIVSGIDSSEKLGISKPAMVSPRSLHKASHILFRLPPGLQWNFESPGDGVIIGKARGNDNLGNTINYTINSAGVAELIITR